MKKLTLLLSAILIVAAGCSHPVDDQKLAQGIQSQIQNDAAINGQVTATSANGVVTLNGQVPNDAARALAAREAAATPGVREVINNLTVVPSAPAGVTPPAQSGPPVNVARRRPPVTPDSAPPAAPQPPEEPAISAPATAPPPADPVPQQAAAPPPSEPAPPTPPPPPAPEKYTISAGTTVSVRLIDALDSTTNKAGDVFRATLKSPIRVEGDIAVPAGADVEGRVVEAQAAGRLTGHATLKLELTKLTSHGRSYPLNTQDYEKTTANRGKGSAETAAGGAALGAIIGAIAGGGRGAGIGTLAGGGAGAAGRAAMKDKGIKLPSETVLSFQLQDPVTVTVMPGENDAPQR